VAKETKNTKLLCSKCGRETNHALLNSYEVSWDDEDAGVGGSETYDFLRCNGCDTATLRITSWFSEEEETSVKLYPSRGAQDVRRPKDFDEITYGCSLDSAYRQTISAFNQRLFTLAGAGVRLIIEGVCKEKGIKKGLVTHQDGKTRREKNLEGKINGLAEAGYITKEQAKALYQIRFLGNDAAHELDQPTRKVVETALDILEHLLEQVFEQPVKARALAVRAKPAKK